MKRSFKIIVFVCFTAAPLISYSSDCFDYQSKSGEAGTWTYGSCYGDTGNCTVTRCFDEDGTESIRKVVAGEVGSEN